MKIGEKGTKNQLINRRAKRQAQSLTFVHSPFYTALQAEGNSDEDLEIVLENIDQLGKKLRDKPSLLNLKNYKAAIRGFMHASLKDTYTVDHKNFVDRFGRRRIYLLVAKIDAELEKLTEMILQEQDSTLELTAKLDEIRGLLLDINF